MGLGKTLQTLSLFGYLRTVKNIPGPYLVICPLSVLGSWMNEAKRWVPELTTFRFHGSFEERNRLKNELKHNEFDIICTTYEQFVAEENFFKHRFAYTYVVIDEGHKIKNDASLLSKALFSVTTQYRLLLTGTPLQVNYF